jgi:cold shock CspA family protein
MQGTVTWFRKDRGYGFINYINTDGDIVYIYFNNYGISKGVTITKGDEVSFEIKETPFSGVQSRGVQRSPQAVGVKLIDE